jgi:hypothetical protein
MKIMARKTIGFKIGIVMFCVHLCMVVLAFVAYMNSQSSTAGLIFIWFFSLDAPIHLLLLLLPFSIFELSVISPLIIYGVFGSSLWFLIPWLMDRLVTRVFPNVTGTMRWITVIGTIPLFIVGFTFLGFLSTTLSIRQERPDELRDLLTSTTSGYLTQRVVFDDISLVGVSSINQGNCRTNAGSETLLACHRGVVFLNDNYEEQSRIVFSGRNFYTTVHPVHTDGAHACRFIAYRLFKHVSLLDSDGEEIWKIVGDEDAGRYIDGVQSGDIDGDGKPEFAIYHSYQDGIALMDEDGNPIWTHPVYSLGHLEMTDVRGNGKDEIIYSNSNNANRLTVFKTLDADGKVVDKLEISTASSEFTVIGWPGRERRPNILLTEENRIRIVDMKGSTVVHLDAPGCRTFGKVKAITVKLHKDEPACLAVRKILHPDLAVLFVYDTEGNLVFQTAQVRKIPLQPALAAVPADETGVERLLVGAARGYGSIVLEYSLAQHHN